VVDALAPCHASASPANSTRDAVPSSWPRQREAPALSDLARLTQRAARGKRRSPEVARFLLDPLPRLLDLQRTLAEHAYVPGTPHGFIIHEPKRRVISALPFRDRIVQHYLIDQTLPALERWFAPQSHACRVGRGTHQALRRAIELHRNHEWLLRLDIAKFFPSIDHCTLLELLLPRSPPDLHWLVRRVLGAPGHIEPVAFRFPGDDLLTPTERRHGLPVGNLTSQVWANAMLTPVDHLLASHLGLGTFVRYCDDVLVYAHDRDRLRAAWDAVVERCTRLRLRPHPTKCRLHRSTEPVSFLGFVLQRRADAVVVRLRADNVRRFRRRVRNLRTLLAAGAMEPEDACSRVRAWLAHAQHGHTRELCRHELDRLGNLLAGPDDSHQFR